MGATFALAAFSLADLASPVRCWKTTLGVGGVLDLVSLVLGGDGVGTALLGGDGVPRGDADTLPRKSQMALLASPRSSWFSTNLRLRSSTAEVSLPKSAVVLSAMSLL